MNSILISTECVADLQTSILESNDIEVIYYDIKTKNGIFRDATEIDSQNVMEYMENGKNKVYSVVPTANGYKNYFDKHLRDYDEIIHICISGGVSNAYDNAMLARAKLGMDGNRVFVVDSRHLSSGQALLTLEAVRCKGEGMCSKEIVAHLKVYIPGIATSFLANNADYLFYNGKVKESVMKLCRKLHAHPVLTMVNGKLTVKKIYFGNYDRAAKKYIRKVIGNPKEILREYGFLTYAGCSVEMLDTVKETLSTIVEFDNFFIQQASATVSCNCGPKTFGILFVRKTL